MTMSDVKVVETAKVTVKQTAIVQFMSDRTITIKLSGVDGITAKMIDVLNVQMYHKLNEMRAKARTKDTAAHHARLLEQKAAEQAIEDAKKEMES